MSHRSRRSIGAVLLLATAALVAASPTNAGPKPNHHGRQQVDVNATASARAELAKRAEALADRPAAAVRALRRSLGRDAVVDIDPLTQTPRAVARIDGFLAAPSAASPEGIARAYLRANRAVFRVDEGSLTLAKAYTDVAGIHHLRFVQAVDGVPVLNGGVRVNIAPDGRIVNVVGSPVAVLSGTSTATALAAEAALATALRSVHGAVVPWSTKRSGDARRTTEFSSGDRAALGLYATTEGLRLGWETF
jgi:extracellular elastinolytic metalloproteinase